MQEPMDRHEHVQVAATTAGIHEQRVVHDEALEERLVLERVTQVIWLVAAILELLILMRIFLKLMAANPNSPFALLIYSVTDLFLFPFFGLMGTPTVAGSEFELSSLVAMVVYFFGFWVLTRLIWIVFESPRARSVMTYEAHDTRRADAVIVEGPAPVVENQVVHAQPMIERHVVYEQPVVRETRVVREQPAVVEQIIVEKPDER